MRKHSFSPYFIIFILFFISLPLWADQLIIEPDMGRQPIINIMGNAHHSIDLVMYGFTDEALLNPLIQQKRQGRTIKVILEENPYKTPDENTKTIAALKINHIPWQGSLPPLRLIHQKALITDDNKAVIMTFNFTRSSFKNQRNFALIIDDPKRAKEIAAIFSADWNHTPIANIPSYLFLSPDDSRAKLLTLIKSARHSLQIYAQNVSDFQIVGALAKTARKGISIQVLSTFPLREKQAAYLTRAGVSIRYTKQLMIHAKVFIIDNTQAVIGSINLTRASLDNNRELSILTQDKKVIAELTSTFNKDWDGVNQTLTSEHRNFLKRYVKRVLHLSH